MAIGDNTNPNRFGTNYNPEEEKKKQDLLAAQNAMMGAGGVGTPSDRVFVPSLGMAPQSLVDQVTQLPPMQEPIPIEVAPPITNDVANGGMQLREPKQTDKGVLGFGSVDVESPFDITRSPDFSNLNLNGVNLQIPPELQFKRPGTGEVGLTEFFQEGSLPRMVTEAAGATFDFGMDKGKNVAEFLTGQDLFTGDKTASEVEGSLAFLQSPEVQASMKAAQAPSGASALGATQGSTSTSMDTTNNVVSRQEYIDSIRNGTGAVPAVAMFKNGKPLEGQELRNAIADKMEDNMSYDRSPAGGSVGGLTSTAPTNGLTTVGGASLSEFLSGQAMPERGFTQEESPLGGRGVTLTPDQMNELSAQREARLDARPDFGEAVSDRDRRAARGDGISMADQTAMAKANARDASPSEVARGNQVANALGVDLETGQPLQATGGLTFDQQLALRKQNFAEGKFDYELAKDANATYLEGIEASKKATTEEAQADTAGRTMLSAIGNMNDAMTRMGNRSGEFFGGGFFGKMASYLPGTSAYDQVADVEFLQSNVALNAMSELKELSPTGSTGFGALSEKELRVLTDKYANLNPFVSADLFQGNLKQLQGEFNNMLNNAWDKHSKEYSPEAANAVYGNRGGSASGATGTPGQAIPNDRNITSAADTLLSDPKYN